MKIKGYQLLDYVPTVHPVIFATFLGLIISKIAETTILFHLVCWHSYAKNDPSVQCFHLGDRPEIETAIHKEAANWNTFLTLAVLGTALFSDLILGAWGDRSGRQFNMLSGFAGMQIMTVALIVVNTFKYPTWTLVVVGLVVGVTGYIGIVPISCYAYLADTVVKKHELTIRMAMLSLWSCIAGLLGSVIVGMTRLIGINWVLVISEIFILIGFLWAIFFVKQIKPTTHKRLMEIADSKGLKHITPEVVEIYKKQQSLAGGAKEQKKTVDPKEEISIPEELIQLFKESVQTFSKPRQGNKRLYLLLCVPCFIIHVSCEIATHSVISLYAFHSPFNWDATMLGHFNVCNGLANLAGIVFSITVLQKWLKFRDSALCLISIASNFGRMLLLGVGTNSYVLFSANIVGLFSQIMFPAMKGLAAQFVEPHEVGKAFTAFTISIEFGIVFGAFVYNSIYNATVAIYPGAVFFVISLLLSCAFVPMLWIHKDSKKMKDTEDGNSKKPKTIEDLFEVLEVSTV